MFNSKLRLGGLAAALAMVTTTSFATTVEQMSLEQMVSSAEAIVVGEAMSSRTVKRDGAVYTVTEFSVKNSIAGGAGSTVEVVVPGGSYTSGGVKVGEVVAGAPKFNKGQTSVLFLKGDVQPGDYALVDIVQGALPMTAVGNVRAPGAGADGMTMDRFESTVGNMRAGGADGVE